MEQHSSNWHGKSAVVTGAANGIGLALAERFVAEGMRVVLSDVDSAALDAQVARLRGLGHTVWGQRCDVTQQASVDELARFAEEVCGPLDLVCNNAGIGGGAADALPLWETPAADWKWVLDINVWGVIHGIRAFVPRLLRHGRAAHVVNTASRAGLMTSTSLYSTSKHTVVAMTEALQAQLRLAGSAVQAAVLCPGAVNTALAANSARLRPDEGARAGQAQPASGAAGFMQTYRDTVRTRMASGTPPAEVADMLMRGLERAEFYIHPGAADATPVQERLHNIAQRRITDYARAFPQFGWST